MRDMRILQQTLTSKANVTKVKPMMVSVQRVATISLLSVLGPVGTIFNLIILTVIIRNKQLQSRTYILYFHLAVCDIMVSVIGCSMGISVYTTGEFLFCQCAMGIIMLGYIISIGTVTLISFDRYIYLKTPMLYFRRVTKRRIYTCLVLFWLTGLVGGIPLLINKILREGRSEIMILNRRNCIITRILKQEYLWIVVILTLLPTIATAVINVQIFRLATKHHKRIRISVVTSEEVKSCNKHRPSRTSTNKIRWNKKAIRTTLGIVLAHLLCTLPYVFVIVAELSCDHCVSYKRIKYAYSLYLLNYLTSIINPLIYTLTNTELRNEVKKLFSVCMSRHNTWEEKQRANTDTSSLSSNRSRKLSRITNDFSAPTTDLCENETECATSSDVDENETTKITLQSFSSVKQSHNDKLVTQSVNRAFQHGKIAQEKAKGNRKVSFQATQLPNSTKTLQVYALSKITENTFHDLSV